MMDGPDTNCLPVSSCVAIDQMMTHCGVAFGTSGVRGLGLAMTDLICHTYTKAFLQHLQVIGQFSDGDSVALACDLRESSPRIVAACARAVSDCGGQVVYCGNVPTPALAYFAIAQGMAGIVVTGSHIPADRNGIKFYKPDGEILKSDETAIATQSVAIDHACFDGDGNLLLPPELPQTASAIEGYLDRYVHHFGNDALAGLVVGVYQHSAVGRDALVDLVHALGGKALPFARSDAFVPVDTEAIRDEDAALSAAWATLNKVDAIISTDGDSDRPLIADAKGRWLRGDVIGLLCARSLGCDTVVTPVNSTTAIEQSGLARRVIRTKIGSPYVIEAMIEAQKRDPTSLICGFEANGGFLLGGPVGAGEGGLTPLLTRDAFLPIIAVLQGLRERPLEEVILALPSRFSHSDRLQNFSRNASAKLLAHLSSGPSTQQMTRITQVFGGFAGEPMEIDRTDGYRMTFAHGETIHLRASGNAPELRCYTEADSESRARSLNAEALAAVRNYDASARHAASVA